MPLEVSQLSTALLNQQKQFEDRQTRLLESLLQHLNVHPAKMDSDTKQSSPDAIANSISEFLYDPDAGLTFDS